MIWYSPLALSWGLSVSSSERLRGSAWAHVYQSQRERWAEWVRAQSEFWLLHIGPHRASIHLESWARRERTSPTDACHVSISPFLVTQANDLWCRELILLKLWNQDWETIIWSTQNMELVFTPVLSYGFFLFHGLKDTWSVKKQLNIFIWHFCDNMPH